MLHYVRCGSVMGIGVCGADKGACCRGSCHGRSASQRTLGEWPGRTMHVPHAAQQWMCVSVGASLCCGWTQESALAEKGGLEARARLQVRPHHVCCRFECVDG